jgi:spermidine synthase
MATPLIELPNPFALEGGVIRLPEPPGSAHAPLLERVLAGTYDKPIVIDDGKTRALCFSLAYVQSIMRIRDPFALEVAYTRKMMGFLFFNPEPRNLLMLGLGGGSLAKYCHARLPLARTTVVEIDPHVIALREQFCIPPNDDRLRIMPGDAAEYVARCADQPDVIMMDAFDRQGLSASVCSPAFYQDCRQALAPRGILVANLAGHRDVRLAHLALIRAVFNDNVLILPVQSNGNHIAFAFRDAAFEPRWRWIESQARAMQSRYDIEFPKIASKLERARKSGYLERVMHQPEFN